MGHKSGEFGLRWGGVGGLHGLHSGGFGLDSVGGLGLQGSFTPFIKVRLDDEIPVEKKKISYEKHRQKM